ncbi:MAG: hypothetical protein QNJ12_20760 [Ilumatobacter sp.]|uniref:hypothetical protein n=1 Tax=Ilumatobacter sp. TaxID=1967498 RepID=UPI00261A928B|nr:hypothetical protein [Ilumatobacter sp.]MDJ0771232.1 hypothetical protein [Ilumatobacter sp.]
MTLIILLVVAAVIVGGLAFLVSRARSPHDGVASFRRQIDALSPEARRPVLDRLQQPDGGVDAAPVTGSAVTPRPTTAAPPSADGDDTEPPVVDEAGDADQRAGDEPGTDERNAADEQVSGGPDEAAEGDQRDEGDEGDDDGT